MRAAGAGAEDAMFTVSGKAHEARAHDVAIGLLPAPGIDELRRGVVGGVPPRRSRAGVRPARRRSRDESGSSGHTSAGQASAVVGRAGPLQRLEKSTGPRSAGPERRGCRRRRCPRARRRAKQVNRNRHRRRSRRRGRCGRDGRTSSGSCAKRCGRVGYSAARSRRKRPHRPRRHRRSSGPPSTTARRTAGEPALEVDIGAALRQNGR